MMFKVIGNLICGLAILVNAYAYNATAKQCGNNRGITYFGTKVRPGIVAVSHDLKHLMGKQIKLHGLGTFDVRDLMHKKHKRSVDIYMESQSAAKAFGKKRVQLQSISK